jgi:ApaG protein
MEAIQFSSTTAGIQVLALPEALPSESNPKQGVYSFIYTITIKNGSDRVAQLIGRHWIIKSAEIQIGEVLGPGVVGLQPTLKPGEEFHYTSGCIVHDPIGSMEGTYTFRYDSGEMFEVTIPRFTLCYQEVIH